MVHVYGFRYMCVFDNYKYCDIWYECLYAFEDGLL